MKKMELTKLKVCLLELGFEYSEWLSRPEDGLSTYIRHDENSKNWIEIMQREVRK